MICSVREIILKMTGILVPRIESRDFFIRRGVRSLKIYVGNLSYSTSEDGLRDAFGEFGAIDSVAIITDRSTGRSKGFGFIEMSNDEEAKAAIDAMNGKELDGRNLNVNVARPPRKDNQRFGGRY